VEDKRKTSATNVVDTNTSSPVVEDKLTPAVAAVFQGKYHATRAETRAAMFCDIDLVPPESESAAAEAGAAGAGEAAEKDGEDPPTDSPPASSEDRKLPKSYVAAPTKEDIEFVLVDGAPLSGHKAVTKALQDLAEDYLFFLEPDKEVQAVLQAWLDYVPPGPGSGAENSSAAEGSADLNRDNITPEELKVLFDGHDANRAVFDSMVMELTEAAAQPPPKKGESVPGEGVAQKYLNHLEISQSMFE
ncbi:unnamed protein product, partial [Amoebophrya sp. A25]